MKLGHLMSLKSFATGDWFPDPCDLPPVTRYRSGFRIQNPKSKIQTGTNFQSSNKQSAFVRPDKKIRLPGNWMEKDVRIEAIDFNQNTSSDCQPDCCDHRCRRKIFDKVLHEVLSPNRTENVIDELARRDRNLVVLSCEFTCSKLLQGC